MNILPILGGRKSTLPFLPPAKIFQCQTKRECKPEKAQKREPGGCGLSPGSKTHSPLLAPLGRVGKGLPALRPLRFRAAQRCLFCWSQTQGAAFSCAPPCLPRPCQHQPGTMPGATGGKGCWAKVQLSIDPTGGLPGVKGAAHKDKRICYQRLSPEPRPGQP